jgi:hypothetical protein
VAESESVTSTENQRGESSIGIQAVKALAPARSRVDAAHGASELPAGYLARELDDAERLLSYASEVGIEVEPANREAVFRARLAGVMTSQIASELLAARCELAKVVRPVSVESLRACADPRQAQIVVRNYTIVALALCAFLLPFSAATFVSSAISDSIRKDTEAANALALNLVDEVRSISSAPTGPTQAEATPPANISPKDMLRELQQFAVAIRTLNAHAKQLSLFAPYFVAPAARAARDHYLDGEESKVKDNPFELTVPLLDLQSEAREAVAKVKLYQNVRYRAVSAQETAAIWSGAVATCVLPILYAVLGACAYLLRLYEEQNRTRTFVSDGHRARFLIAGIGGLVIGLFNNFNVTQGGSLSPFALAFLVGYAADVFFSFLEGLLRTFGRTGVTATPAPSDKGR